MQALLFVNFNNDMSTFMHPSLLLSLLLAFFLAVVDNKSNTNAPNNLHAENDALVIISHAYEYEIICCLIAKKA